MNETARQRSDERNDAAPTEPAEPAPRDELDEVLKELRHAGQRWASAGLTMGQQALEAGADRVASLQRAGEDEAPPMVAGAEGQPAGRDRDELEDALRDLASLGRLWASHGLRTGASALETTADTLRTTARFLGRLTHYIDARLDQAAKRETGEARS